MLHFLSLYMTPKTGVCYIKNRHYRRYFFISAAKGDITHFIYSGYGDLMGTDKKKTGSVNSRLMEMRFV